MSEDTLITDEARNMVGKEAPPIEGYPVSTHEIKRYAFAVNDTNPLWTDEEYASRGPHEEIIAPPLFFRVPFADDYSFNQLEPDGTPHPGLDPMHAPLRAERRMAGGEDIEFFQVVRPGDVLTVQRKIVDIYERTGRSGRLVFTIREQVYTNQRDEKVAVRRTTQISR